MKIAIVGSRGVSQIDIGIYVSSEDEIVSGGAKGVDQCAADYAKRNGLMLTEFLPQYERYGRAAPIKRNEEIVKYCDKIIAFWDGKSRGTQSVLKYAEKLGKECQIILVKSNTVV